MGNVKRTGVSEINQILDRENGIIRVNKTQTEQERLVEAGLRAASGETPVAEGEDKGWLFIGGVNFGQPLYVKDENGVPFLKVTVEAMPGLPSEYLSRVLPALLKRDQNGGVLRLTLRFDDDSMNYSNQPSEEQMSWLMPYLRKK
jgi:hypothetical protein